MRAPAIEQVVGRLKKGPADADAGTGARRTGRAQSSRAYACAVGALGLEGVVMDVHGNHAEIDMRGKRLRAARARSARHWRRRVGVCEE